VGLDGAGDDVGPRSVAGGGEPGDPAIGGPGDPAVGHPGDSASGEPGAGPGVAAAQRVRTWLSGVRPRRADLKADALAGLPGAISSVPDGMATAVLVGVNPAYGLYASFAGKIGGGLTTSTTMMVVTTTTAASLAAGSALADFGTEERASALVLLTMLTGAVMIAAGLLRLGRYIRFVSRSVMLGFLTGVSVNIVFGQLPDLLGVETGGGVASQKAWYIATPPGDINWAAAAVGISALLVLFGLARTRFALLGSLIAVVVPTAVIAILGNTSVATVSDEGAIPTGLPPLALPHLSDLSIGVVTGALAIAAIALVQGAGVAESTPNPDGSPSHANGDFIGQGVGNLVSGLFHGTPVGGSVGSTALNVSAGACSRLSSVFAGLWMLVILVALSGLVGAVAMPTLGAVLIFAAVKSLRPGEIKVVWKTAHTGKIALLVTFGATLALPVGGCGRGGSGLLAAAAAEQGADGPAGRAAGADGGRSAAGTPSAGHPSRRSAGGAGRLREPALRGGPHAGHQAARPARRASPGGGAAAAGPHLARFDVLRGDRRVRGATRGVRRAAVSLGCGTGDGGAVPPCPGEGQRRHHQGVPGQRGARRVDHRCGRRCPHLVGGSGRRFTLTR